MSISLNPTESLNEFIPKSDQHDYDLVNLVSEGDLSDRNRENEIGREYLIQLYEKAQQIYEKGLEKIEKKENMKKEAEKRKTDKFHSYMFPGLRKKIEEANESLEIEEKSEKKEGTPLPAEKKEEKQIDMERKEEAIPQQNDEQATKNIKMKEQVPIEPPNKITTEEIEKNGKIPIKKTEILLEKTEFLPDSSIQPPEILPNKFNSEKPSEKPDIAEELITSHSLQKQKTPPTEESSKKNSDSNQKLDQIIGLNYLKNLYKECLTSYLHEHRSKSDSEPDKERLKVKEKQVNKEKTPSSAQQNSSPSITSPQKKLSEPKKTIPELPKPIPEPKNVTQTPQNVRNNHQRAVSTNNPKPKTTENSQERKFKIKTYRRPSPVCNNLRKNETNEANPKPNDSKTSKSPPKIDISVRIEEINTEKRKIEEKIKDLNTKISSVQPPSPLLKTEKTLPAKNSEQKNLENQVFVKKMQSMKVEMQIKRLKEKQEKQECLMRDIEKLNKEKEKIVEVFKLEKEKTFWQKMQQIEERKADRLIKMTPIDKKKNKSEFLPHLQQNGDSDGVKTPLREPKIYSATPKTDMRSTTPRRIIGIKNTPTSLNKPNYIADLRKQNCELEKNGVKLKKDCQNWERYLKDSNMNKNEKFDSVLNRAQIMENQAKMKEKVALVVGADLETEDEINNLYAESIKAKLALLENLKN